MKTDKSKKNTKKYVNKPRDTQYPVGKSDQ